MYYDGGYVYGWLLFVFVINNLLDKDSVIDINMVVVLNFEVLLCFILWIMCNVNPLLGIPCTFLRYYVLGGIMGMDCCYW